jgi:hypothetical protein
MIFLCASCVDFALFVLHTFNFAGALAFSLAHAPGPGADARAPRRGILWRQRGISLQK